MSTTTTHPAPEEIMALFDHELSTDQADKTSAHVRKCPECSAVLSNLASTSEMLGDWRVSGTPDALAIRISENAKKIQSDTDVPKANIFIRTSLWSWKQWGMSLGATVACLMLVLGFFGGRYQRSDAPAVKIWSGRAGMSADNAKVHQPRSGLTLPTYEAQTYSSTGFAIPKDIPAGTPQAAPGPMIARSASLTLLVKDFVGSRAALDAILARHHAYAADLKASTVENAPRSLVAFLRVPANDLDPTLAELKALGRVQEETQNGEEVTQQHADLVARLKNSRETEQRLQGILAQRTGKMSDVLEIEQEISRVRGEIEQMEAEQRTLEHRVEFASVNLTLTEEYKASLSVPPLSAGSRLRNALITGYRDAGETLLGIVLFFAEYGLTLVIWASILGIPVYWLRRRYRRSLASV